MDTLEMIYQSCHSSTLFKTTVPSSILKDVELIGKNCNKQKAVYTVLVTLLYYKYLHPEHSIVEEVGKNHGCQVIINGLLPTINY